MQSQISKAHMTKLNHHFTKLSGNDLFSEVAHQVALFREKHPSATLLDLGIGDIARPLAPSLVLALETAAREMGHETKYRGYGPSQGYLFLREAIAKSDYKTCGIHPDEIFISDSAKGSDKYWRNLCAGKQDCSPRSHLLCLR